MAYFRTNLKQEALKNEKRDEHITIYKGGGILIQVMAITKGVKNEVHNDETQVVTGVSGEGYVIITQTNKTKVFVTLQENVSVVIEPGTWHEIVNTQPAQLLRISTTYYKIK